MKLEGILFLVTDTLEEVIEFVGTFWPSGSVEGIKVNARTSSNHTKTAALST